MLGAGPDDMQQYLASIDLALGVASPGVSGLTDLLRKTREACSVTAPTRRCQHVISKVVLRKFTERIGAKQQRKLMVYDLKDATARLYGADGAGYAADFVKIDSEATEAAWKKVEDKLGLAIDAAESGTVLSDPTLTEILRNAIALHFARSYQIRDIHEYAFDQTYTQMFDRLAATPQSQDEFRRTYGLEPAGPEARLLGAQALLGGSRDLFSKGTLFRLRVQSIYETVCDLFQTSGLEILVPLSSNKEFLIGDVPALTIDFKSGAAGVAKGVTLDNANTIILPLAPRILVALGPTNGMGRAPDRLVDDLNLLQVREAKRFIHYRPQADFHSILAERHGPR